MTLSGEVATYCQVSERGQEDRKGTGNCPYLQQLQSLMNINNPTKTHITYLLLLMNKMSLKNE